MNQCSSTEELQNIKYRKQLKKFSLEFKQGDLREFYHLLFEQCSQKLFNTTMIFKFLIMITFTIGEIIYFENEMISTYCIVCLFLFLLLWIVGLKQRHQVYTTFRICNLLISMIMYIIVMQVSDGKIDAYSNDSGVNCKENKYNDINYTLNNSKLASFFAVLFSLYQIIYIQIEIKWFFKALHFFFIILLNWIILGVNSVAISYGVIYFTFIIILLYQLEITKKEGSFQMYRVIEDFQSLKTLINDILPMQIFIVQRNSQFNKSSSSQLKSSQKNEIHNQNYGNQINQNSQININANINLKQEEGASKQDQVRQRQISSTEKDSLGINGVSTAFASNKKTIDLKSHQNEINSSLKRKDNGQGNNINSENNTKQKIYTKQQTNNAMINDFTSNQVEQSHQSIKIVQQSKSTQSQKFQFNIEEAKPKTKRESIIQLQTLENDVNIYTEQQETNPPLINNKNDPLLIPSTTVCNHQNGVNCSEQQNITNPLKIKFANKLIHQDFQSSNLDFILKELNNILLPKNQKINNQSSAHTPTVIRQNLNNKFQAENLHDVLISKLYKMTQSSQMNGLLNNQQNQGSGNIHVSNIQLQNQNNFLENINKGSNQQVNTPRGLPNNYFEEKGFQSKLINIQNQRNQNNNQKSPFSQNNNGQTLNGGFQDAIFKNLRQQAANAIGTGITLENEQNFATNNVLDKNIQKSNFNLQSNNNVNENLAWSTHRFGRERNHTNYNGMLSESINAHIQNESAVFQSNQNYQQMVQQIQYQQQYLQSIQSNHNHLNKENLNIYNYKPQNRINKVWEYLNCMYKKNLGNVNLNRSNIIGNNSRRQNLEQSTNNQQEDDKNYDIKLVECKWEGEESIMVIMNNINERLMRERLLQIEQYKDNVIDTISHNLKTPLNCILAPLESIKVMLQQQYEQQQEEQNNFELKLKKNKPIEKNNHKSSNKDAISSTFQNQLSTTGEIAKQVSMAINNCQLLLYMINDMIDYSEIIKGYYSFRLNIDYFKITYIIRVLNNLFLDQMQSKKIEFKITTRIDLSEQILLHDSRRLLQILVNLISNSLKFTLKGKIELVIDNPNDDQNHNSIFSAQQQSLSNKYVNSPSSSINKQQFNINDGKSTNTNKQTMLKQNEITTQNNQNVVNFVLDRKKNHLKEKHIRFTVIDEGIGMQYVKLQKLKRMLFKKEKQNISNSSGLGLTMCYSLIKQIGCGHTHLDIQSEEDIGSSFSFTIQQFYRNSLYPNCTPTNTNFQSTHNLQKQNNANQIINRLNINTNTNQLQQKIVSEIKEESTQSRHSPIFNQDKAKNELNHNVPTFQALQTQQMSTLLLNKPQNSSQSMSNHHNQNSNLSNLLTKTTLENQNLPKAINTIGNDEQILDSSSDENNTVDNQNKVKTVRSSKQIQSKEQIQKLEIQQNTNTSEQIKCNQEINNPGISNMQNKNHLSVNNKSILENKNSKSQKIGASSLSQFSMVSLGTGRADQKRKGMKKNINQLNTCYSSITHRHTMIFGKSLKSDAFDNDDFDNENDDQDQKFEDSNFSEDNQDNQEDYFNSNDSMKIQQSSEKRRKQQIYKSNHISENNLDAYDEKNINENSNKKNIELQQLPQRNDNFENKTQKRSLPSFGETDFNNKKIKNLQSNQTANQEKENGQNKIQHIQLNPCSEEINSNFSSVDESNVYISENKDQIITQKYQSNTVASRNFDSNILNTATNIILDKITENNHQTPKLNYNNFSDNAIDRKEEQFYEQSFIDSNILIPQINTEKDIYHTLEAIFDNKNILVVDDTIYNIVSMKIFFRNVKDLKIEEAYNGRDALKIYQENAINGIYFDYIFMDIEMPIMDGLECIQNIRDFEMANNLRRTTIITVTAYEREQQEVKQVGANALIAKPIQKDKFLQTLRCLSAQNH